MAFSPNGGGEVLVLRTIESAHKTIRVAAYTITSKPIALALLKAHKAGVDVHVISDKSNATARYTAATLMPPLCGASARLVVTHEIVCGAVERT